MAKNINVASAAASEGESAAKAAAMKGRRNEISVYQQRKRKAESGGNGMAGSVARQYRSVISVAKWRHGCNRVIKAQCISGGGVSAMYQ